MNKCQAHKLLCEAFEYDPLEGIEGAAEEFANLSANSTQVKYLGSHETNYPNDEGGHEVERVNDWFTREGELTLPQLLYYTFGGEYTGGEHDQYSVTFYAADCGVTKSPSRAYNHIGESPSFVVRLDMYIDPEAPMFTAYLLCQR
jgi:hypothetical protein